MVAFGPRARNTRGFPDVGGAPPGFGAAGEGNPTRTLAIRRVRVRTTPGGLLSLDRTSPPPNNLET